jgi:hypothetical protein
MGILADLLANSASIDPSVPREDRVTHRQVRGFIDRIGDPTTYPTNTGASAVNEVQGIAIHVATVSGGNFTLTFSLFGGVIFTTGNIAFDANAATIEAAIDAAAATKVPGWVDGDIVVTGGPLTTTPAVLTFSGASVAGKNHGLTTGSSAGLTGGGTLGAIAETTAGLPVRRALAALVVLGILDAAGIQVHGDVSGYTAQNVRGSFPHQLSEETVRDIIRQAAVEDNDAALETALLTLLGY